LRFGFGEKDPKSIGVPFESGGFEVRGSERFPNARLYGRGVPRSARFDRRNLDRGDFTK